MQGQGPWDPIPLEVLVARVRGEYAEMPGLRVTAARRVCSGRLTRKRANGSSVNSSRKGFFARGTAVTTSLPKIDADVLSRARRRILR